MTSNSIYLQSEMHLKSALSLSILTSRRIGSCKAAAKRQEVPERCPTKTCADLDIQRSFTAG